MIDRVDFGLCPAVVATQVDRLESPKVGALGAVVEKDVGVYDDDDDDDVDRWVIEDLSRMYSGLDSILLSAKNNLYPRRVHTSKQGESWQGGSFAALDTS